MKNHLIKIALTAAIIVSAVFTICANALPGFAPGRPNTAPNHQVRTTYCDLRNYPVPPAALSTDLRQLTNATTH